MSGLLFLTGDDFQVKNGTKGAILCNGIRGYSLILFYSTQCAHCRTFIPIFKRLPGTIGGCQFGMANVSIDKSRLIKMAKPTIAPITYVPYVVLYVDGKPYMRYNGPQDEEEVRRFVVETARHINSKQAFSEDVTVKQDKEKSIPAYCIGNPLYGCEDGVCYLPMNEAYTATNGMNQN